MADVGNTKGDHAQPHQVAQDLAELLGAEVVVKLGADGAVAWSRGTAAQVRAQHVSIVDSVGAGDAFGAGYLAARLGGESLQQCLASGSRLAAAALAVAGGRPPV